MRNIIFGFFIVVICFGMGISFGPEPHTFFNLPSLIIVFGGALGLTLAFSGKRKLNWRSYVFHYGRFALWAGVLGTLIGVIQMLTQMKDPRGVGPAIGIGLLTAFYGILTYIICFTLSQNKEELKNHLKDDAVMGATFIMCMGMIGLLMAYLDLQV